MNNTFELPNLPWQALQRRLAEAFTAEQGTGYPVGPGTAHSHWRCAPTTGSWLDRSRTRVTVASGRATIRRNCRETVS
jgi:hypothetical protein